MAATVTSNPADLEPLIRLCRQGKLFEVQEWIRDGRPVALSAEMSRKTPKRNPLRTAIDEGFHSLVQVLLDAGCPTTVGNYRALDHAVELRRADLATLLVSHGADVREVSMSFVLEMWDSDMVELFLSNGASLHRGNPVALALIYKMRPALGLLKRYPDDPGIRKQGCMALRYHASEGNQKWVALLLWAGADPWARGPYRPEELDSDPEDEQDDPSAMELASYRGKLEIFGLKKITAAVTSNPQAAAILIPAACVSSESDLLAWLLDHGLRPDGLEDRGSLAICHLLAVNVLRDSDGIRSFVEPVPSRDRFVPCHGEDEDDSHTCLEWCQVDAHGQAADGGCPALVAHDGAGLRRRVRVADAEVPSVQPQGHRNPARNPGDGKADGQRTNQVGRSCRIPTRVVMS
jgi:hypothetical protein